MPNAVAITHIDFEDLGTLGEELRRAKFRIEYINAATGDLKSFDPLQTDLLIVLGGPIGVYERAIYPFIEDEVTLIRKRLAAELPTLGICLGAQLMAAALGAKVYPGANGKEIGWGTLSPGRDAEVNPVLEALFEPEVRVLHWHGDTFELPVGAQLLASTPAYPNQAFAVGNFGLGLQFHPEVSATGLERWYVGHACELAQAGISVSALRAESRRYAPALEEACARAWRHWLQHAQVWV